MLQLSFMLFYFAHHLLVADVVEVAFYIDINYPVVTCF